MFLEDVQFWVDFLIVLFMESVQSWFSVLFAESVQSWSRHQNCKRIGLVHKASVSYCSLGLLLNSSTGAARINPGHGTKIARGWDLVHGVSVSYNYDSSVYKFI